MNENSPPNQNPIQLQLASPQDLDTFLYLAAKFFDESVQAGIVTFDADALSRTFLTTFPDPEAGRPAIMHTVIVYIRTGPSLRVPVGFVTVTFDRSHTVEPIASVHFLYALPETRKTPIGRLLVDAAIQLAELEGAPVLMAGAAMGVLSRVKTVNNLFRKYGFQESGHCFVKPLKGPEPCVADQADPANSS